MKQIKKIFKISLTLLVLLGFSQCKTSVVEKKVPFEILEKSYFNFVGGQKGTKGMTIKIVGKTETTNITFTTIFFQNHEYKVSPVFHGDEFVVTGTRSTLKENGYNMTQDASGEYGNEVPNLEKKIPFDLESEEAILVYRINGADFYHKLTAVKKMDTIFYP